MKKTLFLTALLGLSSMSTYAEYTADVFLPQSIITVQQGKRLIETPLPPKVSRAGQAERPPKSALLMGRCDELEGQLTSLLAHTTFTLTSDAEGLTGLAVPESGVISVSDAMYEVQGSDLVITGKMTYTPEPATATLSLLALAGLAARRRRC